MAAHSSRDPGLETAGAVSIASGPRAVQPGPLVALHTDASGVSFDFEPGQVSRRPDRDALGAAERLEFSRLAGEEISWVEAPGAPRIASWCTRVRVPAGATWMLRFTCEDGPRLHGVRLARVAPTPIRTGAAEVGPPIPASEWPPLEDRDWPDAPVVAVEGELRGERIVTLQLAPAQYNAATAEVRTYERIRVWLDFTIGPVVGSSDGTGRDDAGRTFLTPTLLNPAAQNAPRPAPPRPSRLVPGVPEEYFGTTAEWIRVAVVANGVHRVTGADLAAAGVALNTLDPGTLRVFTGSGLALEEFVYGPDGPDWGEPGGFSEIGCRVLDGGDTRFDAADALDFYGLAVDNDLATFGRVAPAGDGWVENPHTDRSIYWITWGEGFRAPPLRWPELSAAPEEGAAETTTVPFTKHFEQNTPTLYDTDPWEPGVRWERWWWELIDDSTPGHFWDLSLPDLDATRPAVLSARWWGANTPREDAANANFGIHHLAMTVNGGPAENASWSGMSRRDLSVSFTPAATTRVIAQVPRFEGPNRRDRIYLAWFEVSYWRKLSIPSAGDEKGALAFAGPASDGLHAQFRVGGVTTTDPLVLDVTDPRRPVRLTDGRIRAEVAGRSVTFRVADATKRRYAVTAGESFRTPATIERDARPARWLRDTANAADYILITADEFLDAAERLGAWRRQHLAGVTDGATPRAADVAVIRVSDVYDEFSGGMVDPTAIRNFLQYAAAEWKGGGGGQPLYLCLLGDANRDVRDYERTGVRNHLPTWQNGYDRATSPAQFSSDDFYGRLGGPTDRLVDLIIGRIPASTPEMARRIVEGKIIAAERPTTANPRRARAILTADDNCQGGAPDPIANFAHQRQSDALAAVVTPTADRLKLNLFDYGASCDLFVKPAAKRDLISAMNEGSWLINFVGHGSDQQIYDEKILEVPDVATLDNGAALPVMIAASCSVGKFDRANSEGLAEALIKADGGGCLATIAATQLTFPSGNSELNIRLVQRLFPHGDNRAIPLGTALWLAKQLAGVSSCGTESQPGCDRQQKYSLLGDPASPPIMPARPVRFTARPDSLLRGRTVTVSGEVLLPDAAALDATFEGIVDLRVEDQPELRHGSADYAYEMPGARLFEGRAAVTGGRFTVSFVVPVSLRGGSEGRLRAYVASSGTTITEGVGALTPLPIGGTPTGSPDTESPSVAVTVPGGRAVPGATLVVSIADTSGINLTELFEFRSILMTVTDDAGRERFRSNLTSEFAYVSGSYTRGRVETKVPTLPPGRYTISVSATDNYNNRGEGTLDLQVGGGGGGLAVSELFNHPNPFSEATRIYFSLSEPGRARVRLYTVSGRKLRQWDVGGAAGQNEVEWDGRDAEGDAVANGVYLVRVELTGASGRKVDAIERIVRLR